MSEYRYYEFRALDRPLNNKEMGCCAPFPAVPKSPPPASSIGRTHGRVHKPDRVHRPGLEDRAYFTRRQHAGENIADALKQRAKQSSPPTQMCDALSRNVPKLPTGVEILLANCLAHGKRQFVEVAANFPDECRYVLEMLSQVYRHDADERERGLTPEERPRFHQERSGPVMEQLHGWLEAQFAEHKTEPNSGPGKAITYLLRHWRPLTLFLRQSALNPRGTPKSGHI